jgi:rhodanese-related sulfurtransferase
VLLDVRPEKEATAGFIKGAVNIPEKAVDKALTSFPNKELKPPIVVYDAKGDGSAEKVAMMLVEAGYPGPRVLTGGFAAWKGAGYGVETGTPATSVAYVPKPKAGSIPVADFEAFAKGIPAGVQIIDVRTSEEVDETGMIKGAVNIPAEDIVARLAEIPKDKDVVLHCSTGARAEMSYNILKEKGYSIRFLDATITTNKDGTFTIKK